MEINSIRDISDLLVSGYTDWGLHGAVNVKRKGDLALFNYATKAMYGDWSYFEQVSRGLIINAKTGKVIARPFDKFWNWLEGGRKSDAPVKSVVEKLDGSMVFTFIDTDGKVKLATRGSFDSEQAQWATNWLYENLTALQIHAMKALCEDSTLIFEAIYKDNRIVVDYQKDEEGLYLLAVRDHHTGGYLSESMLSILVIHMNYAFKLPKRYDYGNRTVEDIEASLELLRGKEGFVVEFEDGQRFKFKTEEYLALHRLISNISFSNVLKELRGGNLGAYLDSLPEEHRVTVMDWVRKIKAECVANSDLVFSAYTCIRDALPENFTPKDFALTVNQDYEDIAPYLFALRKGLGYSELYDMILQKHNFVERD